MKWNCNLGFRKQTPPPPTEKYPHLKIASTEPPSQWGRSYINHHFWKRLNIICINGWQWIKSLICSPPRKISSIQISYAYMGGGAAEGGGGGGGWVFSALNLYYNTIVSWVRVLTLILVAVCGRCRRRVWAIVVCVWERGSTTCGNCHCSCCVGSGRELGSDLVHFNWCHIHLLLLLMLKHAYLVVVTIIDTHVPSRPITFKIAKVWCEIVYKL